MVTTQDRFNITAQQVLNNIGYGAAREPSARIMSLVNDYVENSRELLEPSYSCVIRNIRLVEGSLVFIEGSIVLKSEVLARLLENCEKVAVFALTIGNHLGEMACQLAEVGLMVQASVLDAIGSVAVESLADFVQGRVLEVARSRELCVSQRFSPGYCDWDVSQQRMVFRTLDGNCAGIRLTKSCLMLPEKSMSGVIGIGAADKGVGDYNPCKTCDKNDCRHRR